MLSVNLHLICIVSVIATGLLSITILSLSVKCLMSFIMFIDFSNFVIGSVIAGEFLQFCGVVSLTVAGYQITRVKERLTIKRSV